MPYLKICGIRSQEDYETVREYGADYVGFIFADSKRRVSPIDVSTWIKPHHQLKHVGVFVNPDLNEIEETLSHVKLDVIQLHGKESNSFINKVRQSVNIEIWKALPHGEGTLQQLNEYNNVDGFVIDTKVKGKWGGTGLKFDWNAIPAYTKKALEMNQDCFIAGGITPTNIEECLSFNPMGIDLSSGVEENNRKSPQLINDLIERMNV
ncbi:phosphoribosylanthranilate isomerase [Bacillus sp. Marseille-Q3570]|uniref:phosphoribosylanthranilate isomerase n=1 Tax=Bacillus sp. Marseille-Q3570 TaxID=2963522 RepID=UPI0021B73963|nr:phosphoribosylanthranilate isomerase [Bacillus sp. Marseille-Q3570]